MASERLIKRRIKSAKNIAQITKAMQMVAASKMRKAQNLAISGRPYAEKISEMTQKLVNKIDPSKHQLLKKNTTGNTLVILISTNKGLLGGLNTNLFRNFMQWFSKEELQKTTFVTVGKKGEAFVVRNDWTLSADFSNNLPFVTNIPALTTFFTEGFITGKFNKVYLVYSNFLSALKQEPVKKVILPINQFTREEKSELDFVIEPNIDEILDTLLFHYLENQLRDALLEANASEHSARMIAMKNATDNAMELTNLLTLEYNKARQEKITYEIADMVTARMAVE